MSSAIDSSKHRSAVDWVALVLLGLTLLVRGGVLAKWSERLTNDPDRYRSLARNIISNGIYGKGDVPSAYRPPLYPLLLVPCVSLESWRQAAPTAAIAVLHLLLGLATVQLVLWLGRVWCRASGVSEAWAAFAALLVLCDPILLNQSTLLMTETLGTFLAVLALAALTRASQNDSTEFALVAGGAMGLAALSRPTFMVWVFLSMLGLLWTSRQRSRGLLNAAMLLLATVLVLAPWIIRNYSTFGQPIVTTTHGGYTLLLGNNSDFYDWLRSSSGDAVWSSTNFDQDVNQKRADSKPGDEVHNDRDEYAEAGKNIREQPGMFLRACWFRLVSLWGIVPNQVDTLTARWRYPVAVWYGVEYLLAAVGIWALGKRVLQAPWLWGLLLAISFTLVHTVYWSNLRMRAPLMPFMALLASVGAAWIFSKFRSSGKIVTGDHAPA
jgi:hypothetical protein